MQGNKQPIKSSSLPVQEDELTRLNAMTVEVKKTPLRSSSRIGTPDVCSAATNWTTYQRSASRCNNNSVHSGSSRSDVSNICCGLNDFARKPLFRPVTHQDIKATHSKSSNSGYISIVSSCLTPYMK